MLVKLKIKYKLYDLKLFQIDLPSWSNLNQTSIFEVLRNFVRIKSFVYLSLFVNGFGLVQVY